VRHYQWIKDISKHSSSEDSLENADEEEKKLTEIELFGETSKFMLIKCRHSIGTLRSQFTLKRKLYIDLPKRLESKFHPATQ